MSQIEVRPLGSVHTLLPALCRPEAPVSSNASVSLCWSRGMCAGVAQQQRIASDEGLKPMNNLELWPDIVKMLDLAALAGAASCDIVDGQELVIPWMKGMLYC